MLIEGNARFGTRTKDLAKDLAKGDVAIIRHEDLDRVAAESFVSAQVAAVINTKKSISGKYPNHGPEVLNLAGIPLIDVDQDAFSNENKCHYVKINDKEVEFYSEQNETQPISVFEGLRYSRDVIKEKMISAQKTIGDQLKKFSINTLEYIQKEGEAFFQPVELPPLKTNLSKRHVLIIVRGHDYKKDLKALKPYIKEHRPAIIAVDGAADALLDLGLKADIVLGDFDSVSEKGLDDVELVLHVDPNGEAPGRAELEKFGKEYFEFQCHGMSEDIAMIMAYEAGAELIIAVGTHGSMVELLDKGRKGMSSTFITRMRLGPVLVDAKGVSRLYEGRVRRRDIVFLVLSALAVCVVIAIVSDSFQVFLSGLEVTLKDLWLNIVERFS